MTACIRANRWFLAVFAASFSSFFFIFETLHFLPNPARRRAWPGKVPEGSEPVLPNEYPVADSGLCGTETKRARAVLAWASQRGAYVHRNITVAHLHQHPRHLANNTAGRSPPSAGPGELERGLVARGHIANFTRVLIVPPALQLSVASLRGDGRLAQLVAASPVLRGGLSGLSFYLLHEAANASSHLRPYLCSLPRRVHLPILQVASICT
jgi:hypothetical protein